MSFKEKVIRVVMDIGQDNHIKNIIKEAQDEILKGVGLRMLKEQEEQTKRFLQSLEEWEKKIDTLINSKINAAVNKIIEEGLKNGSR
jgi:hypothetical protein